jgi:segregation and condensation protein B
MSSNSEKNTTEAPADLQLAAIIEAVLFTSDHPLSIKELSSIISEAEQDDIELAIQSLKETMASQKRGVELAEVAGGYVIRSKPEFASWIIRAKRPAPTRLSRAAMETLAIVAYRQPATRAEIENIRGVDSSGILRMLLDKNLIRTAGRKDVPGKPLLYATTKHFLEMFQLATINDLPDMTEIEE